MSRITSPLERATTPAALTRIAQFDYWHVVDRETSAEIAIAVDRSVTDRSARVIGLIVTVRGRVLASGADMVPPWGRGSAREALVFARSLARADELAVEVRRAYADQVLAEVQR